MEIQINFFALIIDIYLHFFADLLGFLDIVDVHAFGDINDLLVDEHLVVLSRFLLLLFVLLLHHFRLNRRLNQRHNDFLNVRFPGTLQYLIFHRFKLDLASFYHVLVVPTALLHPGSACLLLWEVYALDGEEILPHPLILLILPLHIHHLRHILWDWQWASSRLLCIEL